MKSTQEARDLLARAWPAIVRETRSVLGSELHYQAMVYHCLRAHGPVPVGQIGMNVKMWIDAPVSSLFRELDVRKHEDFRGGFEPIPDVCLFSKAIRADWRRRNAENTFRRLLLAIEIKASERSGGRLTAGEIVRDIEKLQALYQEARHRKTSFVPVMMVIDTAPDEAERMTAIALERSQESAREAQVEFLYVSSTRHLSTIKNA